MQRAGATLSHISRGLTGSTSLRSGRSGDKVGGISNQAAGECRESSFGCFVVAMRFSRILFLARVFRTLNRLAHACIGKFS